jgi:hypothetical protein
MKGWVTLKEAAGLLGTTVPAVRYRAIKKGQYDYKKEQRQYGETTVVSTESLLKEHPEVEDRLSGKEGMVVEAPAGGPEFVVADAGRIRALADELVKVERREREIRKELRSLMERL